MYIIIIGNSNGSLPKMHTVPNGLTFPVDLLEPLAEHGQPASRKDSVTHDGKLAIYRYFLVKGS